MSVGGGHSQSSYAPTRAYEPRAISEPQEAPPPSRGHRNPFLVALADDLEATEASGPQQPDQQQQHHHQQQHRYSPPEPWTELMEEPHSPPVRPPGLPPREANYTDYLLLDQPSHPPPGVPIFESRVAYDPALDQGPNPMPVRADGTQPMRPVQLLQSMVKGQAQRIATLEREHQFCHARDAAVKRQLAKAEEDVQTSEYASQKLAKELEERHKEVVGLRTENALWRSRVAELERGKPSACCAIC